MGLDSEVSIVLVRGVGYSVGRGCLSLALAAIEIQTCVM